MAVSDDDARERMLVEQLEARGFRDPAVLGAMRRVPRHRFVDRELRERAYDDTPLPIGERQTISQPYMVALMTEALALTGSERVLEVGTGSGYQAAVLAALVKNVYTVERIEELLRNARRRFRKLGIENIRSKYDDGRLGWAEYAPYDAIMLTAAGDALDPALFGQLADDGVLVAPVGPPGQQRLLRYRKGESGWSSETLGAVSFVPLLGGVT